ncbi:hypothetical protein CORC01_04833 [Colletotrichum orchidophilum]|uniref:Heterokaryon incompatibility domain-containing protein n=1 Tax=Colletotrichum orchidophilum TaxID=1209926 RepID=A0A1G4BF56_9PEZI|nr:uncharacterized protein CORC01_04833 [Colletotrichum orchidophilum]OHE99932.1 hypothetical protein CORC01_04833 [Colletotrichum orchidophilum]
MEVDGLRNPYWLVDGDIWNDEVENTPLMQRAWVLQERFLAPRVLHFGQRQLAWECNELTALEMFPAGVPSILLPQSKFDILSALIGSQSRGEYAKQQFREAWNHVVGQYSRCKLTQKTDKLVAFSGVAKMVEACTGNEYIAGTWKNALIYDLGWYRTGTDSEEWPSITTSDRAPSWSWMAVDGEIFFPPASDKVVEHFATILAYPVSERVGTSAFQARGEIELECVPLMLSSIEWAGDTISEFEVAGIRITDDIDESGSHLDLEGSKEEVTSLVQDRGVLMVPLFATDLALFAVMVSEEGLSGSYVRVGAAKIEYGKTLDASLQAEIPDGWVMSGSSSWIVNKNTSQLLEYLAKARKETQRSIRLN